MRQTTSVLVLLAAALLCWAKAPQGPPVEQGPPCDDRAAPCPCSVSGTCPCDAQSDCGCLAAGSYRWVATSNANQTALYLGSVQLGNWWHAEGQYRRLETFGGRDAWVPCPCPVAAPAQAVSTPTRPTYSYVQQQYQSYQSWQHYAQPYHAPRQFFFPGGYRGGFRGGSRGSGCST